MAQAGSGSNRLVFSSSRGGIIIRSAEDYDSEIHVLILLMTLLPARFTLFIIPIIFLLRSGLPGDEQLLKAANTINHEQVYLFPKTSHWSEISH